MKPLINVKHITVAYHDQVAVYDASFSINQGDFIGIIGENGSGKTTVLKAILGIVPLQDGTISIDQDAVVGYVPQYLQRQDYIFPATSKEVVLMGLLSTKKGMKRFTKKDHQRVDQLFDDLGITDLKNKRVGELSGGQQQRVLLARALIHNPNIILLDEPTSALDKTIETSLLNMLEMLNKKGVTIVVVTHDLASMGSYVDRIIYMKKQVLFNGPFKEFCSNDHFSPYIHTHDVKGCGRNV